MPGATATLVHPSGDTVALGAAIDTTLDPTTSRSFIRFYDRVRPSEKPAAPSVPQPRLAPDPDRLVVEYLPLARQLAARYTIGNHNADDLVQVANVGLVLAARRFDASRGTPFAAYAKPTIMGELRRYFRDHAWAVRVPRTLQQMATDVHRIEGTGVKDDAVICQQLGILPEEVAQARRARQEALTSKSLDFPLTEDSNEVLGDTIGGWDDNMELVEQREALRSVLPRIPVREAQILKMRFFEELSQSEIADRLKLSQVHVSRLLTRTLTTLKEHFAHDIPLPSAWNAPAMQA